jgi:flavin reductase (DIM6/NTAB) family NADH-FMN oxidoreductase RutF
MKQIDHLQKLDNTLALLPGGVFLTVKDRSGRVNTMTIGWALFGVMWRVPTMMIAVRPSRYTFAILENADDFTVTFPYSDMKEQLNFCGTKSGHNVDKFKECGLVALPAQKVVSPIIKAQTARYYECKIVQATAMDKQRLIPEYDKNLYQDKSYHTYYFGEIVAAYET